MLLVIDVYNIWWPEARFPPLSRVWSASLPAPVQDSGWESNFRPVRLVDVCQVYSNAICVLKSSTCPLMYPILLYFSRGLF